MKSVVQAGSLYIETTGIRLHEFHNWQSSLSLAGLREHPESPGLSRTLILIRQFQPDSSAIRRQYPQDDLTSYAIQARRAAGRQPSVSIASASGTILSSIQLRVGFETTSVNGVPAFAGANLSHPTNCSVFL